MLHPVSGQPQPGIQQRPVTELAWVLAAHPGDPLAAQDSISPGDLATIRYIACPEGSASRQQLEDCFARLGTGPPAPVGVAGWDTAILLAELGIGHAIVPALPRLTDPSPGPARTVRQWTMLSPLATEFAELVATRCSASRAGVRQ